jgi:EmrB/QacA subfamily drug resistance transporter
VLFGRHHAAPGQPLAAEAGALRPGLTLAAASVCIFVINLDFFALNLALPKMASDLGTTTTNLQWVVSGYMLALAAFLIPGGRLGDILGRRRMLFVGLAVFGLSSLGAGLAQGVETIVAFRVIQGLGAGILFPLAVAVITDAFPPQRTMRAIGNAYGIGAVGVAFGPIFGGGVTELIGWRWVLFANVVAAAAAIAIVAAGVRESRDTTVPRTVDFPGLLAVALGIAAVTFAIDRSTAWSTGPTVATAAAGLLLLVAFVLRERTARWPLVSLDLFRNAPYVIVTLMAAVANIAFVVATFATTIYLQQVDGYTPLAAGVIFIAASVTTAAAGPLSGRLGERFDIPRTIFVATLIGSAGLFVLSLGTGLGPYLPALALFGLGYGIGWAMASVGTQTVVPAERAGQASGVTLAIVIGLGGLGVATAAALIEAGGAGGESLADSVETLMRWVAIAAAFAAAALTVLAARFAPPRAALTPGAAG